MLMSGMKVKLKKPPRMSHACGSISVMPECSNQRTIYFVYITEPENYIYCIYKIFCIHTFFDIVFCMSDHIFVLSDQNSDLAGQVSFQQKKCNLLTPQLNCT